MGKRKVQEKWHDEELNITKYGIKMMRIYLSVGAILGFLIGLNLMYIIQL